MPPSTDQVQSSTNQCRLILTQFLQVPTSSALYWLSAPKYQPVFERISTCRSFLNLTTYKFTLGVEFDQGYLSFFLIATQGPINWEMWTSNLKVIPPILADYDQCGSCSMYNLYVLGHYLLDLCQLVQWEEQRYGVSCSSDQLLSFFACNLYFAQRFCCWIYMAAPCCPNSFIAEGKAEKKSEDAFGCKAGWSGWIFWRHFHRSCYTTWDRGENRLMACQRKACCVQFFRNSEGQAGRLLGILSGEMTNTSAQLISILSLPHKIPP